MYPKSDIHTICITQPHVPTPTLTFSNAPSPRLKSREFIREFTFLQILAWKISYKTSTCIALILDCHLSSPTLCMYPAPATLHGICNRHEPACQICGKVNLPRERN